MGKNLEGRLQKVEKAVLVGGSGEELNFSNFLGELLQLIDGKTRGLPEPWERFSSEGETGDPDTDPDPEFDQAYRKIWCKYAEQDDQVARKAFMNEHEQFFAQFRGNRHYDQEQVQPAQE